MGIFDGSECCVVYGKRALGRACYLLPAEDCRFFQPAAQARWPAAVDV
jgi:hypothetical protein